MANPRTFHFRLPPYQGPPIAEPPHAFYPGVQAHWSQATRARTALGHDGRVRAFVIHATAGSNSAGAMSVMFAHRASWHWLIPDENEPEHGRQVWACAPERRAAFHVRPTASHTDVNGGARHVNYWSLGVEIVNTQSADNPDPFSEWQVEQAAALVRYAWAKYPDMRDVVSHAKLDPSRRVDPGANFNWERFKELVLSPPQPPSPSGFDLGTLSFAGAPLALPPIEIVSPGGGVIDCDPRLIEGATYVEARPLIESLGFHVEYDDTSLVMRIRNRASAETEPLISENPVLPSPAEEYATAAGKAAKGGASKKAGSKKGSRKGGR
jgi:N-acetylmuramoyl-L-alanine amidase